MLISIVNIHAECQDYENLSTYQVVSPCEPVCCPPCDAWIISADLLYWRALQNGLECGCGPEIKDRWNLGYRIGLEYDFACTDWDIGAYWTHFQNSHHQGNNDRDHARWKIKYDTIDLVFGREFFNNSCVFFTPFIGLRGAFIDEKLQAHFGECGCDHKNFCDSFDSNESTSTDQNHKEKFWGVGPLIGINAGWRLGCGFSLYGSLGVGFLYGHFKINVHDFQSIPDPTDDGNCCIQRSIHACQAIADASVGIQWEHCFCNNIEAILALGLEHHRYFNHNQIGGYGDLCLDGAVFSAGIKF